MALKVPKQYIHALNLIRNLSSSSADELLKALESVAITASPDEMAQSIAVSVPSIPKEALSKIADFLFSIYHVREFSELNRNNFLKEFTESVREVSEPKISDEDFPEIRRRFASLLQLKSLESLSKAIVLQRDQDHVYCEARIVTDIRPVFGEDVKIKPVGAALTHTLSISYHEGLSHKEFYVVLDEVDLNDLKQSIERAETKAETLTQVLSDSGIPRLGV